MLTTMATQMMAMPLMTMMTVCGGKLATLMTAMPTLMMAYWRVH